jgi:hypothetical protein
MNPDMRISIPLARVHSVENNIADIHDRIAKCAYDKFLERGSTPGFELEDWLSAEADLIANSRAGVRVESNHVVAEIFLPNVEPSGLYVSVTTRNLLVASAPDETGRQVFQMVHFPEEIDLSEITAEYVLDTLIVSAAISGSIEHTLRAMQVA